MTIKTLTPPPRSTANPAPVRPAGSVRRTTSIDVSWPDGVEGQRLFIGTGRDVWTPVQPDIDDGAGLVLAEARFDARITDEKVITAIHATPNADGLEQLVGARAGGHLRMLLRETLPDLVAAAHPLYLILDDLSGTALVSSFAWAQWFPDWAARMTSSMGEEQHAQFMKQRLNVCWGLKEGNSGGQPGVDPTNVVSADAGELLNAADPFGWHNLPENEGAGFRRARRIDVTRDHNAGVIRIDSAFQDSAKRKGGGRIAIHEYLLRATADIETLEILTMEPEARILPYSECPGAIHNTQRLVGKNLAAIRDEVLAQLRGSDGCTHLNDALRALADVPELAGKIAA